MLYFDSHFSIGRTHLICEDYARRGISTFPWVMVSDGCSASEDSDIGSRLLTLTAQKQLSLLNHLPDYEHFGKQVISKTADLSHTLGLPDNALDATLLLGIAKGRTVHIYIYGDGFIVLKNHQQQWRTIEVSFTQNAPFYLSYWLNEDYRLTYQNLSSENNQLKITDHHKSAFYAFDKILHYQFSLDDYPMIAICSDGLSKFVNMTAYQAVSVETLLPTLFDFPSLAGSFVKRRLPAILKGLEKENILPFDDFSMGVFVDAIS
ncbi:MAG: hypothetical protein RIT27_2295 [Pseudomonadota bacterium]|jgi:hypothetical protein